jgi:UTP-glucose-1-phosphate uridylyltransferase
MQKIRKAVIPAAGYGTRFLPATKATPKEMLPIVDKPTIQYIVEEAMASGIEDILIISGHGKRAIEDHFDGAPALEAELRKKGKMDLLAKVQETADINIHYIRQRYMRGLGDAILCAKSFMGDEPFAVLLGDDVVYNPPGEIYLEQGWLPVRYTEPPAAEDGWHYEERWAEDGGEIVQGWELVKDPDDISPDEAMKILLGGAT